MVKRIVCFILIISVFICVPVFGSASVAESDFGISIYQYRSMAGCVDNTPYVYGSWCQNNLYYPFSLYMTSATLGTLSSTSNFYPDTINAYINIPDSTQDYVFYLGITTGAGVLSGVDQLVNFFTYDQDIPGYDFKGPYTSNFGFKTPGVNEISYYSMSSSSYPTATVRDVGSNDNNLMSTSVQQLYNLKPNAASVPTSGNGDTVYGMKFKLSDNSGGMRIYKITVTHFWNDAARPAVMTVSIPTSCFPRWTVGSSSELVHSDARACHAIFVPLFMGFCTSQSGSGGGSSVDYSDQLDNIVTNMVTIQESISGDSGLISQFSEFNDFMIHFLTDEDNDDFYTFYEGMNDLYQDIVDMKVNYLSYTDVHLDPVTHLPVSTAYSLADMLFPIMKHMNDIIDYDTSSGKAINVTISNLDTYISSISSTIDDVESKHDEIVDAYDDLDEGQQAYFDEMNDALDSAIISDFTFSSDVQSGFSVIQSDFEDLWDSLNDYTIVYEVALMLALCMLALRHIPMSSKGKKNGNSDH